MSAPPPPADRSRRQPPPLPKEYVERARANAPQRRLRLGELLQLEGVVTEADVERALAVQKMGGGRLGAILVKLKLCTDQQIRAALSRQLGVEFVELQEVSPSTDVIDLLPAEMIKKYEAVPVRKEAETLYLAMKDPYNLHAIDDIRFATNTRRVVVQACTESAFAKFIEEHLQARSLIQEILEGGDFYARAVGTAVHQDESDDVDQEVIHDLKLAGEQPPIITLCNFLLVESIRRRASDIHIEPYETYFRVRLRIDGRLQTLLTPPRSLHSPMITRVKIMGEMDIAKRRIPQDGHIAITYQGETCHYRVSTLPTVYGEKCVIRLLKKEQGLTDINALGFSDEELGWLRRALNSPQGIVLVTGPTGSGKTTTLHAGLSCINDPEVNIVTLEDPVEASLSGINHVQINEAAGVSFSSGLRSILRQDPDVVFVGEMRDPEVSAIAVKAALTGHLVLSTLHTNSAADSLLRLEDMGVARHLLANALLMIIAQRLLRRVCQACRAPYEPTAQEVDEFKISAELLARGSFVHGKGCEACFHTGYKGRRAVYEILRVTNAMRTLIRSQATVEELLACAEAEGMQPLFSAGVRLAAAGETSLSEVRRCLSDSR
ncbi:MAG: GspE/PulE family protein [Polyangiaceae bacterium]